MPNDSPRTRASNPSYPRRVLRQAWRDTLSVYYANTPIWRLAKSAGLLVFGLFCWSAANLLLSYRPDWTVLRYVIAYGFVLVLWGPLTHLVFVPFVIRLRRTGTHPAARWLSRNGSKANLSVFFAIVLVLGTFPVGPMILDFQPAFDEDRQPDVDPDLVCVKDGELIRCHLSPPDGVDHVVVTSGGTELRVVEEPPFEFELREDELESVVGQKQFGVELRDEDGDRLRGYTRTPAMIREG